MRQELTWLIPLMLLGVATACSEDSGAGADGSVNSTDASGRLPDSGNGDAGNERPDAQVSVAGCSTEAVELVALVNQYRGENGLPAIAASPSLCMVGDAHVVDLNDNAPDAPASCNMHSWSDQGSWSACCYTSDHMQAQCMWDKPRELTAYTGNGYENAAGGGGTISPTQALNLWKGSPGHNDVILNRGIWADQNWQALGAGIQNGYAVLWFGSSVDPANP